MIKTFLFKSLSFFCVSFLLLTAITTSSCKKDKTCHGKIFVYNAAGKIVTNAKVVLDANAVSGDVTYETYTDDSGTATFEIKLPGIFDVTATKGTLTGKGVLRVDEPGKSDELTITIQ